MSFRSTLRSRAFGAILAATFLATSLVGGTSTAVAAAPTFVFHGSGYGHGIGMSQYGAQGFALNGSDYASILRHYYSGTSIDKIGNISTDVKVNLDPVYTGSSYPGATDWTIRNTTSRLRIWNSGTEYFAPAGQDVTLTYNESLGRIEVRLYGTSTVLATFYSDVWAEPETTGVLRVRDRSGGANTYGVHYRGKFFFDQRTGGKLNLINYVSMQQYLYGVVPREMPAGWHAEALKVQAVAARSYAYADVVGGRVLKCTTWSQMYCGYGYESTSSGWVGESASTNAAIDATDDVVVRYNSSVITTYFSSQSGGHTASVEDVWVPSDGDLAKKAAAYPWLRGVPDPYEELAGAPNVPWKPSDEKTYDGTALADKLRGRIAGVPASPAYVRAIDIEAADSGFARYVTFTFSTGAKVTSTGDTVRSVLGLKSSKFYFGPPYQRVYGADRYATSVAVSKQAFTAAPAVVLASGEGYADALSGTGLAGAKNGPLLLTGRSSLPSTVKGELTRLAPATVYIMGGTQVVTAAVEQAVKSALPSATVIRVAGRDRFETSYLAAEIIGGASTVVLVNGTSWPDAVSASSIAYAQDAPMLLTPADRLSDGARTYLTNRRPTKVILIGGSAVLNSPAIENAVSSAAGVSATRLWGADRYYTSSRVARYAIDTLGFTSVEPYFASGETYADALSGGALAGTKKRVMLLTGYDKCWTGTASGIAGMSDPSQLWIIGGPAAVSSAGVSSLQMEYATH